MSISLQLQRVLDGHARARAEEPFGRQHELWEVFRSLREQLEDHPPVRSRASLAVNWSAGQGGWAKIPYVVLFDTRLTRTTQRGFSAPFCSGRTSRGCTWR